MSEQERVASASHALESSLEKVASPSERAKIIVAEMTPHIQVDGSLDWIFETADLVERYDVPMEYVRGIIADLTWYARDVGQRLPSEDDWRSAADQSDPNAARRALVYVHGQRLRFDFKFEELDNRCSVWLPDYREDGFVAGLAAFAALGMRSDRGIPLLDRALSLPDADMHCRYVCLHAMWFGTNLERQAERMIQLSDEMIGRGEDWYNLYFWRCYALRRLGRLDEAMDSIDRAIALLPVGMNMIHQDYVREREMVKTTQLLNEQISAIAQDIKDQLRSESEEYLDDVKDDLMEYSRSAQRIVSESLVSLVEVLGVFVALAGFLLGSGTLVFRSGGFWQHLGAIAILLVGSLAFFVILRSVVRISPEKKVNRMVTRWLSARANG